MFFPSGASQSCQLLRTTTGLTGTLKEPPDPILRVFGLLSKAGTVTRLVRVREYGSGPRRTRESSNPQVVASLYSLTLQT